MESDVEIAAEGLVAAPPQAVFAFLSDLENHWLLADPFVEVLGLDVRQGVGRGGKIRVHGPLGLRRTATTRVLEVSPPRKFVGTADAEHGTCATLRWTLWPHASGTAVRLSASLLTVGSGDRLLLAVGGERWLRDRFEATIERLAEHVAARERRLLGEPDRCAA